MIKKQDSEINQKSCFLITLYYFDDFLLFAFLFALIHGELTYKCRLLSGLKLIEIIMCLE